MGWGMLDLSAFQSREINDQQFAFFEQELEKEKRGYQKKCLFYIWVCAASVAIALLIVVLLVFAELNAAESGAAAMDFQQAGPVFQLCGLIGTTVMSLTGWWDAERSVHAFERVLLAARLRDHAMFMSFAPGVSHARYKKQPLWKELLSGAANIFF